MQKIFKPRFTHKFSIGTVLLLSASSISQGAILMELINDTQTRLTISGSTVLNVAGNDMLEYGTFSGGGTAYGGFLGEGFNGGSAGDGYLFGRFAPPNIGNTALIYTTGSVVTGFRLGNDDVFGANTLANNGITSGSILITLNSTVTLSYGGPISLTSGGSGTDTGIILVPEPSSIFLSTLAFGCFSFRRRRKHQL